MAIGGGYSLNKEEEEILNSFQCDLIRSAEENFAQMLAENDFVRLFFINENRAFTDGKNIVIDPSLDNMFVDKDALSKTEKWMNIPNDLSKNLWFALEMVTRAQNVHESLHIIYSPFPSPVCKDKRNTSKAKGKILALIFNIIEDAFIEAAGCSEYDNLELYLTFGRVSRLFSNTPSVGTTAQVISNMDSYKTSVDDLMQFLDYMVEMLLYPMVKQEMPKKKIAKYVELSKNLFIEGSICVYPEERFSYAQQIFDIIEPLIPDGLEDFNTEAFEKTLGGLKTHEENFTTIGNIKTKPKIIKVTRRLFQDLNNNKLPSKNFDKQFKEIIGEFIENENKVNFITTFNGRQVNWNGNQFDCSTIHKDITILEKKPKINFTYKKAYFNIYNRYHLNINSYNSKFKQLLKVPISTRNEKQIFGSGINSRSFGDVKKRYWYRPVIEYDVPDIAIMLMIDGSGSMDGDRNESAIISSVILHEVLKKQNIKHAIVEHRAIYDEPIVEHNILIDFSGRDEEKYNILNLDAYEGTREGLSLYWAEKYIKENTSAEDRLILVLSDGVPAHGLDGKGCYLPPISIKDTANAVRKITKRGTKIIAIALDEEGLSCYEDLKEMYPQVVACTNLKHLTGQLLGLISKQFL